MNSRSLHAIELSKFFKAIITVEVLESETPSFFSKTKKEKKMMNEID